MTTSSRTIPAAPCCQIKGIVISMVVIKEMKADLDGKCFLVCEGTISFQKVAAAAGNCKNVAFFHTNGLLPGKTKWHDHQRRRTYHPEIMSLIPWCHSQTVQETTTGSTDIKFTCFFSVCLFNPVWKFHSSSCFPNWICLFLASAS